jgi:hypothetical protein
VTAKVSRLGNNLLVNLIGKCSSGAVTRTSLAIPLFPFSEVPRDLAEQHCQIAEGLSLSLRIGQDACEPIASCSLFEIPGCDPAMRADLMF